MQGGCGCALPEAKQMTLIEEALIAVIRVALDVLGKDRTIQILQAEYDAAEIAFEKAEDAKFGPKP